MNQSTLEKLEFSKIRVMLKDLAYFEGGQQLALALEPYLQIEKVQQALDENEEAMELLRFEEPSFLVGLKNVAPFMHKAKAAGILMPAELWETYKILRASRLARKYLDDYPHLENFNRRLYALQINRELEKEIQKAVDEEGFIRDDASALLRSTRKQISTLRIKIKDYLQDFVRSGNNQALLQDAIVTERSGRYVVPVKQEHRLEVKGIVHDESSSGATVFIEPMAVVENNNKIRSLESEEKREIERILSSLTIKAALFAEETIENYKILAELDLIFAKARLAYKLNAYKPEINSAGVIELYKARHPLLGEKAVPINIELGKKYDLLVITGPNTGGKTVVLKTVGLLTVMAMCGLFIPAQEKSKINIYQQIFVDIGDEQSIEQSLSTFSSHMQNIINILKAVNEHTLVLLDELGAGTDPVEGAALARAILEKIKHIKAGAIVTTHQSELKSFAYQNPRVENACVDFDPVTLMPTYKLTIGTPGQSNAFAIAERLGLDNDIVQRAQQLLPKRDKEIGEMIRTLKEKQYLYEQEIKSLENDKQRLLQEKEQLSTDKEMFQKERERVLLKAQSDAEVYVRDIKRQANEALEEIKQSLRSKERTAKWHEIEQSRHKIKKIKLKPLIEMPRAENQTINPGDCVKILNLNQKGYVLKGPNSQGEVQVQVGIMKINVPDNQLIVIEDVEEKKAKKARNSFLEKAQNISHEIDLRGQLSHDALIDLDKYLCDALLVGLPQVRIIHGKGTGALRKAVREYLRNQSWVKDYRDGMREEGGFGVTVVEFK